MPRGWDPPPPWPRSRSRRSEPLARPRRLDYARGVTTEQRFSAAVYGATGLLGAERLRRLLNHPQATRLRVHAADHLGLPLGAAPPHVEGQGDPVYEPVPDADRQVEPADVVFHALPHAASSAVTQRLVGRATR